MTKSFIYKIAPVLAALTLLAACDGIEAASKATERAAYRLNFKQVPLVASKSDPGRVLRMHVFEGYTGEVPRAAREVPFHAELRP